MSEQTKNLSDGTKRILMRVNQEMKPHPCVDFNQFEGTVTENFRIYDLTTKEGRESYKLECQKTISHLFTFELQHEHKVNHSSIPKIPGAYCVATDKLQPWLLFYYAIEELTYQIETQDLIDGFE